MESVNKMHSVKHFHSNIVLIRSITHSPCYKCVFLLNSTLTLFKSIEKKTVSLTQPLSVKQRKKTKTRHKSRRRPLWNTFKQETYMYELQSVFSIILWYAEIR